MEEWVLLGECGSDADSVQFVDGSVSDKASKMSFTTVQIGDALDSSGGGGGEELPGSPIGGAENEDDDGKSNGDYGYFDLNLAGSKAVFGASDYCFDLNLLASILSMGSVGCDTGIHGVQTEDSDDAADELCTGGRHLDDIDMESIIGAEDGDGIEHPERRVCAHCANIDTDNAEHSELGDTESSEAAADNEQPESCSRGRRLDDISMESLCAVDELIYGNEMMTRMQYLARATKSTDDCTESSDEEESDDDTENSDAEESDCSDDSTECSDARNSHIAAALQPLRSLVAAAAREASLPPTAPHLFFPNAPLFIARRAGAYTSTAASPPPPCAPHLYFHNRAY